MFSPESNLRLPKTVSLQSPPTSLITEVIISSSHLQKTLRIHYIDTGPIMISPSVVLFSCFDVIAFDQVYPCVWVIFGRTVLCRVSLLKASALWRMNIPQTSHGLCFSNETLPSLQKAMVPWFVPVYHNVGKCQTVISHDNHGLRIPNDINLISGLCVKKDTDCVNTAVTIQDYHLRRKRIAKAN